MAKRKAAINSLMGYINMLMAGKITLPAILLRQAAKKPDQRAA
jgi:hypothetical protein